MSMDATKELFEHIELFGKPALFTNSRIDVSTVPLDFYCYDLRGSDSDPGRPVTLERHVGINHAGSVLTPQKVKIPESGYKRLKDGLNFLGEEISLEQFCREHQVDFRPRLAIQPASIGESGIFYAQKPEIDRVKGAIGHVRIDFGQSGKEFWHTWHPRGDESLNSAAFKEELAQVVDQLRDSVLKDLHAMTRFCYEHDGKIDGGWRQNYGYIIETENYRYCLRCSPGQGDYHAYLTCFDLNVQRENLVKENSLEGSRANRGEKGVIDRLSEHREQIREKGIVKSKEKQVGKTIRAYRNGGNENEVGNCGKALCRYVAGGGVGRKREKGRLHGRQRVSGKLVCRPSSGAGAAGSLRRTICQMALWRFADSAGGMEV